METALDAPSDGFNPYEKNLVAQIREHGWFRTSVFPEGDEHLGFTYTTGFWLNLGFPELIVFSIDGEAIHDDLWDIYRGVASGHTYPVGATIPGLLGEYDAFLAPVHARHYPDYLLSARWFYGGEDFPCLQLIWPDRENRFPWQTGANPEFALSQPDLSPDGWAALYK